MIFLGEVDVMGACGFSKGFYNALAWWVRLFRSAECTLFSKCVLV